MNVGAKRIRTFARLARFLNPLWSSQLRTSGSLSVDPGALGIGDVGRLYEVPKDVIDLLHYPKILPQKYRRQLDTLQECVFLCRRPYLEVLQCLKAVKPSFPSVRVVLWGKQGTGKSITLCQTLHYAHTQQWIVFIVPSAMALTRPRCDVQMSSYAAGRIDTPDPGIEMLKMFKHNNVKSWEVIAKLQTERDYKWSKAEMTAAGKPLTDVVEMGLSAPIYACDCVGALLRELKRHSSTGAVRLLVAVDQANSLYGKSLIKRADRTFASAGDLTLVHHLRRAFATDWCNGACVLVADKAEVSSIRDKHTVPLNTPLELFGEEGFDAITPFVPVETELYTQKEIDAMYDYYVEKHWITSEIGRSERGRFEMTHLSAFNPYFFERLCAIA